MASLSWEFEVDGDPQQEAAVAGDRDLLGTPLWEDTDSEVGTAIHRLLVMCAGVDIQICGCVCVHGHT